MSDASIIMLFQLLWSLVIILTVYAASNTIKEHIDKTYLKYQRDLMQIKQDDIIKQYPLTPDECYKINDTERSIVQLKARRRGK